MTNYKGRADNDPIAIAKAREAVRGSTRPQYARNAERDASRDEDDGRGDEAHPDSSWVDGFNASQRLPLSDSDQMAEDDTNARDAFDDSHDYGAEEF